MLNKKCVHEKFVPLCIDKESCIVIYECKNCKLTTWEEVDILEKKNILLHVSTKANRQ